MEKFCVITPSRGDRKPFIEHLKHQMSRFTVKPDKWYLIDYPPLSGNIDLVERVFHGISLAKADGYDLCFIIEEDDWYSPIYFELFGDMDADFFGDDMTWYYNIRTKSYSSFHHPGRSSLFTTGFRISKLDGFQWGGDQFLDIRLWKFANENNLRTKFIESSGAIGIKHNTGLCAGKGHTMKMRHEDPKMNFLRTLVDAPSFEFYSKLSYELNAD